MLAYYHQSVSPKIDDTGFERKDLLSDLLIPVAARDAAEARGWQSQKSNLAAARPSLIWPMSNRRF